MKKSLILLLIGILVIALIVSITTNHSSQSRQSAASVLAHGSSPITMTGPASLYPDPLLTPGAVLTTDSASVCTSGYAGSVRNVPVAVKREVYREYGIEYPQPSGSYEVDHFISLELGGSNAITNLWPEPAMPQPGFHEKDVVENYLHKKVCSGEMTLEEAQKEIRTDWYAVYIH